MSVAGLPTAARIQLRVGWKTVTAWVVVLGLAMAGTVLSISDLYDTPAKIASYARAGADGALQAINGRVYGLDTLGGVVANEFGFIASFALPLMGISLLARATRQDEQSGRLEMVLAGRIGRSAPLVAAVLVATGALLVACAALTGGLVMGGVDVAGSLSYAAALGALGLVFAGIAAVAAQLAGHARGVYATGLGALVVAYLLRGAGAVLDNWLVWLSPLGWVQETRSFDGPRWWPVVLLLGVGVLLNGLAAVLNARRDLGSAPLRRTGGTARASAFLVGSFGLPVRLHRGTVAGWSAGAVVVSGALGALAQPVVDALGDNESLEVVLGSGLDGYLAMAMRLLGLICAAYVVQAAGTLRAEESAGRLAPVLSGSLRRPAWLGVHVTVIVAGLLVVACLGTLALGLAAGWSTGHAADAGALVRAMAAYLPAVLVLAALALALFGTFPRLFPVAWLAFAFTAVTAFLGDALSFPAWLADIAPLTHVGQPPQQFADGTASVVLAVVAAGLGVLAFAGFLGRDVG